MSSPEGSAKSATGSSNSEALVRYYLKYAKNRQLQKYLRISDMRDLTKSTSDDDEYLIKIERLNVDDSAQTITPQSPPAIAEDPLEQTPTKEPTESAAPQPPDSSSKYARRLEWDSLGDVGYQKSNSTGNLSTLERSVLKELHVDSPSEPNIHQQSTDSSVPVIVPLTMQSRRERWRQTLDNLGKKYSSTSVSMDTQEFSDQPQSTPKLIPRKEQACQTSFDKTSSSTSTSALISSTSSSYRNLSHRQNSQNGESQRQKSCQTSLAVQNTDKFCQTSFNTKAATVAPNIDELCQASSDSMPSTHLNHADKLCQTSFEQQEMGGVNCKTIFAQTTINRRCTDRPYPSNYERLPQQTDQTEREYAATFAGQPLQDAGQQRQPSSEEISQSVRKANKICKTLLEKRTCQCIAEMGKICQKHLNRRMKAAQKLAQDAQPNLSSRRDSFATQSSFEYHPGHLSRKPSSRSVLSEVNSNATDKSKASSDSDKENRGAKKSQIRTKSDIDLGIQLLCSLVESQSLSASHKKKLAKKIFEKIMKQPWSSSSLSLSSRSSTINSSSLIEISKHVKSTVQPIPPECIPMRETSECTPVNDTKSSETCTPSTQSPSPEPVTMREWLHPLTRSEKEYDKHLHKKTPPNLSPQVIERQKQLTWIEAEINRLEKLKDLLIQEPSSKSHSGVSKDKSKSIESVCVPIPENEPPVEKNHERKTRVTRNLVIYDEPATSDRKQADKVEYKITKVTVNGEECASTLDSRKNHRSKLETPTSSSSQECQSVSAFADQLQKQFMDNYLKKERERCASEHYSEPRVCGKKAFTRNPSYTSVASSAFCVSSEMSIPIVDSSSSSTTTHQYESHEGASVSGVAVQTTCSIIRTNPIFGPRCKCVCTCGKQCRCSCPKPTIRMSGQYFHQTVQVKPKAVAYVIRFNDSSSDTDCRKTPVETLTLQQQLQRQHPDFCSNADKRREILQKLHKLRQERERQIREIAECSNNSSICRKLEQLPPPPIRQVRVCATREMKGLTRKRYCKLPEVVEKQEREKLERRKKTTRLITHIFNKKLQRMVHNGKLSLEYSRTVI